MVSPPWEKDSTQQPPIYDGLEDVSKAYLRRDQLEKDTPISQGYAIKQNWCSSSGDNEHGNMGCHEEPGFNQTSKKNEKPRSLLPYRESSSDQDDSQFRA
jgi:hypothetical protein